MRTPRGVLLLLAFATVLAVALNSVAPSPTSTSAPRSSSGSPDPSARAAVAVAPTSLPAAGAPTPTTPAATTSPAPPTSTAPAPSTAPPTGPGPGPSLIPAATCTPAPLAVRAGQVLVVGMQGVFEPTGALVDSILGAGVGGVLLTGSNIRNEDQARRLAAGLAARSSIPLLVSTDEEAGRVSSYRAVLGRQPSARTLAARHDPAKVRQVAAQLGGRLAGLGVTLDFAPVADLSADRPGGIIGDRSFSADPARAASYVVSFASGLADAGVLPVVKHFPGHGRSTTDSHVGGTKVTTEVDELQATDLVPFAAAIQAGVPVVMFGHVNFEKLGPFLPASLAPEAYALLRRMGFTGVAMTDSLGMGAVSRYWDRPEATVMALNAGADSVLATDGGRAVELRDAIVAAVQQGRLPEARLDEAVARVLALKGVPAAGILCQPPGPATAVPAMTTAVHQKG